MSKPISPFESNPPSGKSILLSVVAAVLGAAVVLVTIILPAEYNIDPTRIGGVLGLTALNEPGKTVQLTDVVGGNEKFREVAIPDFGKPVPLPNPTVFQKGSAAAKVEEKTVTLKPGEQTEIKALLKTAQVLTFSWQAEGGIVYTDFMVTSRTPPTTSGYATKSSRAAPKVAARSSRPSRASMAGSG